MRDNRIDVIRGFAILLLTVTHTMCGPALLADHGHYYPRLGFFFHGADIFVAFSGLICGIVYTRTLQRQGASGLLQKGWARALQLWLFNAIAFFAVAAVVLAFNRAGVNAQIHNLQPGFWSAMTGTLFLFAPIPYFNVLNVYIIFLVILPVFVLLQARWRYTIVVSFGIYVVSLVVLDPGRKPDRFFVSPMAWQFLFFGAVVVGMHLDRVRAALPPLLTVGWALLLYFFVIHYMKENAWIVHNFSSKYGLGALRIVDLVLVAYVLDRLIAPDIPVTSRLLRNIASIGSNSLFSFCCTLVLCYAASNLLVVFDASRAIYLIVILAELSIMVLIGALLLHRPAWRAMTQAKWVERWLAAVWPKRRVAGVIGG